MALSSCGGPSAQIVETRFLAEASSAPTVTAVVDLGGRDVPLAGELIIGGSDGIAVIGETLWVRGASFGKQPAVVVGGRPAAVLARTGDGGIVVRVPAGTPAGPQAVEVSHAGGKGDKVVVVKRYVAALSPHGSRVAWAEVTHDGPVAASVTEVLDAEYLALSPDGRAAYLTGRGPRVVTVVEVTAAGGPKPVFRVDLPTAGKVTGLYTSSRAPVVAVLRDGDVILLDVASPLRPARSASRPLPAAVRGARIAAADLSPDGKFLAVVVEEGNRLLLLDLTAPGRADVAAELPLAPDVRVGILVDVAFSPDGRTVWVAAGETAANRSTGPQATRVFAVRIGEGAKTAAGAGGGAGGAAGGARPTLELARTLELDGVASPLRISPGRSLPLASGATIRLPPEKATVYLSASPRDSKRWGVFRIGAEDTAAEMAEASGSVGSPDVSPDGRWLMVGMVGGDGSFRILSVPADGRPGSSRTVEVIPQRTGAGGRPRGEPPRPSDLRVQP